MLCAERISEQYNFIENKNIYMTQDKLLLFYLIMSY